MPKPCDVTGGVAVDPAVLGQQIWDAILQLHVDWINGARMDDRDAAACSEQELRFFALTYASLMVDGAAVTTGRKAIVRSIYAEHGGPDTANVHAMLDAVILREEREQASARR